MHGIRHRPTADGGAQALKTLVVWVLSTSFMTRADLVVDGGDTAI